MTIDGARGCGKPPGYWSAATPEPTDEREADNQIAPNLAKALELAERELHDARQNAEQKRQQLDRQQARAEAAEARFHKFAEALRGAIDAYGLAVELSNLRGSRIPTSVSGQRRRIAEMEPKIEAARAALAGEGEAERDA
ncbi:MAG TPA: hypothetical protein VGN13_05560 [Solirubrobacteraceae bacterium]